jgi:hypothetical protein
MRKKKVGAIAIKSFALLVVLGSAYQAMAQDATTPYPNMAPIEQYLMDRTAEIVLARSAAPESIARDVEVMVLGRHGYETAIKGKNAFLCMVERSWTAPIDDADFWNPKLRAPICLNAAAAHSYLPRTIKKTELTSWTQESSDDGSHCRRHRQEGIAGNGTGGDVLHAVEAGLPEQPRWALASSPHVLLFFHRPCGMGSGSAGFSHLCF